MLHLILLVLCWIFVAVAVSGEAARSDTEWHKNFVFEIMFTGILFGTPIWLILEGIYHWVVPRIF